MTQTFIRQEITKDNYKLILRKSPYGTYQIQIWDTDGTVGTIVVEEDTNKARITHVFEFLRRLESSVWETILSSKLLV